MTRIASIFYLPGLGAATGRDVDRAGANEGVVGDPDRGEDRRWARWLWTDPRFLRCRRFANGWPGSRTTFTAWTRLAHEAVWDRLLALTCSRPGAIAREVGGLNDIPAPIPRSARTQVMAAIAGIDIALWDGERKGRRC